MLSLGLTAPEMERITATKNILSGMRISEPPKNTDDYIQYACSNCSGSCSGGSACRCGGDCEGTCVGDCAKRCTEVCNGGADNW